MKATPIAIALAVFTLSCCTESKSVEEEVERRVTGSEDRSNARNEEVASDQTAVDARLARHSPPRPGELAKARDSATATWLKDGRVLIAGGYHSQGRNKGPGEILGSVELYDPASGHVRETAPMLGARYRHTATPLLDGRVLILGGVGDDPDGPFAELFDPDGAKWSPALVPGSTPRRNVIFIGDGGPSVRRVPLQISGHSATRLADGRVLAVGGRAIHQGALASAFLFDPSADTWSAAAPLSQARDHHTANLLPDGRVIVTGGRCFPPGLGGGTTILDHVEAYEPGSDTWQTLEPLPAARSDHTASVLLDGSLLVIGGLADSEHVLETVRYDPISKKWSNAGRLAQGRFKLTSEVLPDGAVLAIGGFASTDPLATVESFSEGVWKPGPTMGTGRNNAASVVLPSGAVLVFGGQDSDRASLASIERL